MLCLSLSGSSGEAALCGRRRGWGGTRGSAREAASGAAVMAALWRARGARGGGRVRALVRGQGAELALGWRPRRGAGVAARCAELRVRACARARARGQAGGGARAHRDGERPG